MRCITYSNIPISFSYSFRSLGEKSRRGDVMSKPTREDVIKLAYATAEKFIGRRWRSLPREQADEAKQNAAIRANNKYEALNFEDNWESLIKKNARGAVLDYIRGGEGFEESELKSSNEPEEISQTVSTSNVKALSSRVDMALDEDGQFADVEQIAGLYGVFNEMETMEGKINWPLVSRLASEHFEVLVVGMLMLGFYPQEVAEKLDISRERILQVAGGFLEGLDSVENYGRRSTEQIIFAFGLSEYFHQRSIDNGYGWDFKKYIDLFNPKGIEESQFFKTTLPGYDVKRGECHKKDFRPAAPKKTKVTDDGLTEEDRKNQLKFEFEV